MNWNGQYVSVESIIARVYRELNIKEPINYGDAIEWIADAMEIIGAPTSLVEKVQNVKVENYRAQIPVDLHLIQTIGGTTVELDEDDCNNKASYTPMRYSTDAFHHYYCKHSKDFQCSSDLTYKVNDHFINPNFETGQLLISYYAIPTDDRGFPKVPDDQKFKRAVAGEVKWRLGFLQWQAGKMRDAVYQKIEQERDWYIGAAQTKAVLPSPDQAEAIKNNWLRLIPKINQHATGFKGVGEAEQRYTHNAGTSHLGDYNNKDTETYFNIQTTDD